MSTKRDPVDRLEGLGPVAFPSLVRELWRRAGWSVAEQGEWDDTFLVVDEDRGDRPVLRPLTHTDGRVSAPAIPNANEAMERHGTDGVTVVAPNGFTKEAASAADVYGVDAVGPDTIGRQIGALDATDRLVEPAQIQTSRNDGPARLVRYHPGTGPAMRRSGQARHAKVWTGHVIQ